MMYTLVMSSSIICVVRENQENDTTVTVDHTKTALSPVLFSVVQIRYT